MKYMYIIAIMACLSCDDGTLPPAPAGKACPLGHCGSVDPSDESGESGQESGGVEERISFRSWDTGSTLIRLNRCRIRRVSQNSPDLFRSTCLTSEVVISGSCYVQRVEGNLITHAMVPLLISRKFENSAESNSPDHGDRLAGSGTMMADLQGWACAWEGNTQTSYHAEAVCCSAT